MSDLVTRPDLCAADLQSAVVIPFPLERRLAAVHDEARARRRHPSAGSPAGRCS